jgi:hypothetical protein
MKNSRSRAVAGLKYIAASPQPEHGGFHPQTVTIAKLALAKIEKLQTKLDGKIWEEFPA